MTFSARLCAVWLVAAAALLAYDFGALKPQGYLSDFAHVVDPAARAEIERYAKHVEETTGAQMALITLPSLQGEPIEDVANTLFRKWGVGAKGANNGVLFLLAVAERKSRLEVGYGLEATIPDGYAGSVLRNMRPLLRERQYGAALLEGAHTIGERLLPAADPQAARNRARSEDSRHFVPVLIPLVVVFLAAMATRRRRYYQGGYGGVFPTWTGSSSGGGFGGYDSSDSFGGFGGGDSGGGGASSDW